MVSPRPSPLGGPPSGRGPWEKGVEDLADPLGGDAETGVADADPHLAALGLGGESDHAALRGVLRGIQQQVQQDLGETHQVALDQEPGRRGLGLEPVAPLREERGDPVQGVPDDVAQLDRPAFQLELAAHDA